MKVSIEKLERLRVGLRQLDIALQVGCAASEISLFERSLKKPKPNVARKLNQILGKRVYDEGSE